MIKELPLFLLLLDTLMRHVGRGGIPRRVRFFVVLSTFLSFFFIFSENGTGSVVSPYACVGAREKKQKTL